MNNYNFKDLINKQYNVYLSGWKLSPRWDDSDVLLKDSCYDSEPFLRTKYLFIEVFSDKGE